MSDIEILALIEPIARAIRAELGADIEAYPAPPLPKGPTRSTAPSAPSSVPC